MAMLIGVTGGGSSFMSVNRNIYDSRDRENV